LLFIAGAALRVADITRVFKDRRLRGDKGGEVAKLFARHIKLEEHVTYLRRTKIGSAVGTPGRVGKLLCEKGKQHLVKSELGLNDGSQTRFLYLSSPTSSSTSHTKM